MMIVQTIAEFAQSYIAQARSSGRLRPSGSRAGMIPVSLSPADPPSPARSCMMWLLSFHPRCGRQTPFTVPLPCHPCRRADSALYANRSPLDQIGLPARVWTARLPAQESPSRCVRLLAGSLRAPPPASGTLVTCVPRVFAIVHNRS